MELPELKADVRIGGNKGAARAIRRQGRIPAVCYGRGLEPLAMSLDPVALSALMGGPFGVNTMFDLSFMKDGKESERRTVMLKSYDRHPVTRRPLHADFQVVGKDSPIEVDVPIRLIGKAKGEEFGGRIRKVRRTIRVRCLPMALPVDVEFDISDLDVKQRALVSEIELPEGLELIFDADYAFAQVSIPRGTTSDDAEEEEGDEEEGDEEGEEAEEEEA